MKQNFFMVEIFLSERLWGEHPGQSLNVICLTSSANIQEVSKTGAEKPQAETPGQGLMPGFYTQEEQGRHSSAGQTLLLPQPESYTRLAAAGGLSHPTSCRRWCFTYQDQKSLTTGDLGSQVETQCSCFYTCTCFQLEF